MTINKKIQNYQYFFSDQVREAEMEQKSIIKAPMNQLFRKEGLVVGYVGKSPLARMAVPI